MLVRVLAALLLVQGAGVRGGAAPGAPRQGCRGVLIEGEVNAGEPYNRVIGNGLKVYLQPIHSGWILRVLPVSGLRGEHDYAELATPPYESVTPLSVSTDFAFRAQDAVGWNPRRFRFATSAEDFERLEKAWLAFEHAGATPPAPLQVELSSEIAQASEGTFTILDSRLIPGTADQWKMAAAVASHFTSTAHTLVQEPEGRTTPLGKLVWLRFRIDLTLPAGFAADKTLRTVPRMCSTR